MKANKQLDYDPNLEDTGRLMTASGNRIKRIRIIVAIAALIVVAAIAVFGIRAIGEKKYNDQIEIAEKALMEGDYEQAETKYLAAVDMNKRKPKAREGLAYVYALEGKFEEATIEYRNLYDDTGDSIYSTAAENTAAGTVPTEEKLIPVENLPEAVTQGYQTVTEMNDQMKTELVDFIGYLPYYFNSSVSWEDDPSGSGFGNYDYRNAAECGIVGAIIWIIPCIDYSKYPVNFERDEGADRKDPLGKVPDMCCSRTNAEAVNWVAKNIFNASDEQIKKEVELSSAVDWNNKKSGRDLFYEYEGYYYHIWGGIGWETSYDFTIDNYTVEDDCFIIDYTQIEYMMSESPSDYVHYRVRMQYRIIDGKGYWSLYTRERVE